MVEDDVKARLLKFLFGAKALEGAAAQGGGPTPAGNGGAYTPIPNYVQDQMKRYPPTASTTVTAKPEAVKKLMQKQIEAKKAAVDLLKGGSKAPGNYPATEND